MNSRINVLLPTLWLGIIPLVPAMPTAATDPHRLAGYLYLSPAPEAPYVLTGTEFVLVRFNDVDPDDLTNLQTFITVDGASSGVHSGTVKVVRHALMETTTVVYELDSGFSNGEIVTVTLEPVPVPGASGTVMDHSYEFAVGVSHPDNFPLPALPGSSPPMVPDDAGDPGDEPVPAPDDDVPIDVPPMNITTEAEIMPNGVSIPKNFPKIDVMTYDPADPPAPGYIFIDNRTTGSNSFNVIFDNEGNPIWYLQEDDERRDMKVQRNGNITMLTRTSQGFIELDTNYRQVANYTAANGYSLDEHELVVLEDNSYLLFGIKSTSVDMTQYVNRTGGAYATVYETVLQQFTAGGDLIFQWRAWDHFDIRTLHDTWPESSSQLRFVHMNAIAIDNDGAILLDSRRISEVSKIDPASGDMIWRLGQPGYIEGHTHEKLNPYNQFTFVGDWLNGFNMQHSITVTGENRYLVFDNGEYHVDPGSGGQLALSRAAEYQLDLDAMTATLVFEYRYTPDIDCRSMGHVQRLPNGNTLINWANGGDPKLTEVRPDGTLAYDMNWVDNHAAYRTWRFPWNGIALEPYLIVEPYSDNITLIFNQFGDPAVDFYEIFAGTLPEPTTLVATSDDTLEHLTDFDDMGQRHYFRVRAVRNDGSRGDYSNEVDVVVNIQAPLEPVPPGQNMVPNGDFENGTEAWTLNLQGAVGSFEVVNGVAEITTTTPGADHGVQLIQGGYTLIEGSRYLFKYDAWLSTGQRNIEVKINNETSTSDIYNEVVYPAVNIFPQTFEEVFQMEHDDGNARIVFNVGDVADTVYLDNIVLLEIAPGDFDDDGTVDMDDVEVMTAQWLDTGSGLQADLNGDQVVNFADYAIQMQYFQGGRN